MNEPSGKPGEPSGKMGRIVTWGLGLVALALAVRLVVPPLLPRARAGSSAQPGSTASAPVAEPAPPTIQDLSQIKSQIEQAVAAQPKSYEMRMRTAQAYMEMGENEAARLHLRSATELSPRTALAWIALGDAAMLTDRLEEANSAYQKAAKLEPNNALLLRGRGQVLIKQQRFAEARALFEKGLRLHPDDIELLTALGNLLLVMNKPGLAATTIERALKRTPERPDLHFMAATAYQRDLRLETAIRHLRECVRIDPKMDTAWGQLGLYLNNLSRFEEAGPALMQAIQLNPGVSHYHWALGDAFYLRSQRPEDRKQAFELYRKALEMDPKNDRALYSFGMALSRTSEQQNLTEAIGLFERLVALQPDDMNAHYKLAELARRLNHPEKAAKHLVRFQELSKKGYRQTRDAYRAAARRETAAAHARQGKELLASGNYQRAAAEFQIALERNPRLSEARAGLAAASRRLRAARDSR